MYLLLYYESSFLVRSCIQYSLYLRLDSVERRIVFCSSCWLSPCPLDQYPIVSMMMRCTRAMIAPQTSRGCTMIPGSRLLCGQQGRLASRRPVIVTAGRSAGSDNKGFSSPKKNAPSSSGQKKKRSKKIVDKNTVEAQSRPPTQFAEIQKQDILSPGEIEANLEFEKRLQELERSSEVQKAKLSAEQAVASDILQTQPNYDNPPPLSSTLMSATGSGQSTSTSEEGTFGPSQVVLGALSLVLIGIFLVANGGSELGYATKRSSSESSLAPEQRKDLEAELGSMESRLQDNAGDLEALESSAVIQAQLGNYKKSSELLEKLADSKPDDQDVLRLLGETYSAQGNVGKATETFRKAFAVSGSKNLEILTLLTDSLMQAGKQKDSIAEVESLRRSNVNGVSDVELGMLQAKLLAQWRGHTPDALVLYEDLCNSYPDDFRPFLGRGLLLKSEGRMADAQRMFVQARYLSPPSSKATVEALIKGN